MHTKYNDAKTFAEFAKWHNAVENRAKRERDTQRKTDAADAEHTAEIAEINAANAGPTVTELTVTFTHNNAITHAELVAAVMQLMYNADGIRVWEKLANHDETFGVDVT